MSAGSRDDRKRFVLKMLHISVRYFSLLFFFFLPRRPVGQTDRYLKSVQYSCIRIYVRLHFFKRIDENMLGKRSLDVDETPILF